jgi:PadR family transcriptional regulator, regulatory protein PadR
MPRGEKGSSFMNGVPELLILQLLDRREMYGYELVEAIRVETGEALSFGEGCIYPILHALERKGMLKSRRMEKDGRGRVYYAVTPAGKGRLRETIDHWTRLSDAIDGILKAGLRTGTRDGRASTAQ